MLEVGHGGRLANRRHLAACGVTRVLIVTRRGSLRVISERQNDLVAETGSTGV